MSYAMISGLGEAPSVVYIDEVPTFVNPAVVIADLDGRRFVEDKSTGYPGWRNGAAMVPTTSAPSAGPWVDGIVSQGWGVIVPTSPGLGKSNPAIPVIMSSDALALAEQIMASELGWTWVAGPPKLFAEVSTAVKTLKVQPQFCKLPSDPTFREGDVPCAPPTTTTGPPVVVEDGVRIFRDTAAAAAVLDSMYYVEEQLEGRTSVGKAVPTDVDAPVPPVPWVQARASGGLAVMAWPEDFATPSAGIRVSMTDDPHAAAAVIGASGPLAWVAGDPTLLALVKNAASGKPMPGETPATASATSSSWVAPVAIAAAALAGVALLARSRRS